MEAMLGPGFSKIPGPVTIFPSETRYKVWVVLHLLSVLELSGPAWMLLKPYSPVRRTELSGPAWMLLEPYSLVRRTELSGPAWMLLEPYSQVPHATILGNEASPQRQHVRRLTGQHRRSSSYTRQRASLQSETSGSVGPAASLRSGLTGAPAFVGRSTSGRDFLTCCLLVSRVAERLV